VQDRAGRAPQAGHERRRVGPGELVKRVAYPGALGSNILSAPVAGRKRDALAEPLPLLVPPLRTSDTGWAAESAERVTREERAALTAGALLTRRKTPPVVAWEVRFANGKEPGPVVALVGGKPPENARMTYTSGSLRLEIRADAGKLGGADRDRRESLPGDVRRGGREHRRQARLRRTRASEAPRFSGRSWPSPTGTPTGLWARRIPSRGLSCKTRSRGDMSC
jgi:hypothetical protein